MLQSKNRIKRAEFNSLFKKGKTFFIDRSLFKSSNIESGVKVAVVVSSKVSKKAVRRNFIKRIFYNLAKDFIKNNKITKKSIIIIPSKEFGQIKPKEIRKKIQRSFEKYANFF